MTSASAPANPEGFIMTSDSTMPVHSCTFAGLGSSRSNAGYLELPGISPVIDLSPVPHVSDIVHVPFSPLYGWNFHPLGGVVEDDPSARSSKGL
jgi:hypothetical protein